MSKNYLKINPDNTEVMAVPTKGSPWSNLYWPPDLGTPPTILAGSVKSLGTRLDNCLSMSQQVVVVCGACTGTLRKLWRLAPLLTASTLRTVVSVTVLSRLDYGNALYLGLPNQLTGRLQVTLNATQGCYISYLGMHTANSCCISSTGCR